MKKLQIGKLKVSLHILVICAVICSVVLAGTTFAWFTKTLNNQDNLIKVGYFGVELFDKTEDGVLFPDILWVPGMQHEEYLTVKNTGNYSIRYQVEVTASSAEENTDFVEFLECAIVPAEVLRTMENPQWEQLQEVALNSSFSGSKRFALSDTRAVNIEDVNTVTVKPGKTHEFAVVLRLSDKADITASGKTAGVTVKVRAGQGNAEFDDLGNRYDSKAPVEYPSNLLYNGEFEIAEPLKKLNWSYKNKSDFTLVETVYNANTENTYLSMKRTPGGKAPYAAQAIKENVQPGKTYVISGKVKDVLGANVDYKATAQVTVGCKDADGKNLGNVATINFSGANQPEANTWVEFKQTFTVPAGAAQINIQLKNTLGNGEIQYDDIFVYIAE